MKKRFKIFAAIILIAVLAVTLLACGEKNNDKTNTPKPGTTGKGLTPSDIKQLDGITLSNSDYNQTTTSYGDISAEAAKLQNRITDKHDQIYENGVIKDDAEYSGAVLIFANSDPEEIINAMFSAGLSRDKMVKTVDYLAGDENKSVSREDIVELASQKFAYTNTDGWSLFDDWDYYEELKDRADSVNGTTEDDDNVKRQYRNMLRKVFNIGMTPAEFGRVATAELLYATEVTEGATMANSPIDLSTTNESEFDRYCKENMDYETLVYLRAFNAHYNGGTGKNSCIALYAYYYLYENNSYKAQSDEEFEKQLTYGHYGSGEDGYPETFTNDEWWEYVSLQRDVYTKAYRYNDKFYKTFYDAHLSFQAIVETHETFVYGLDSNWQGKSYTQEMRNAATQDRIAGQLAQSDWSWCYSGSKDKMNEYNAANSLTKTDPDKNHGDFEVEMQELKYAEYLLTNMTKIQLGNMLAYEVYSYSGEAVRTAREMQKEVALMEAGKKDPEDVTSLIDGLNTPAAKEAYAKDKTSAILGQFGTSYSSVGVDGKASAAATQPWSDMLTEVQEAMSANYDSYSTWEAKKKALDDNVIKKTYECGSDDPAVCRKAGTPAATPHINCEKVYDTDQSISKFADSYEVIMRYMVGSLQISFSSLATTEQYKIAVYSTDLNATEGNFTVGYFGNLQDKFANLATLSYVTEENCKVAVTSGNRFIENLDDKQSDAYIFWVKGNPTDLTKPTGDKAAPAKSANNNVTETASNNSTAIYNYVYTFAGWYYDVNLKYEFNVNDKIRSDLKLYAGYNVKKTMVSAG